MNFSKWSHNRFFFFVFSTNSSWKFGSFDVITWWIIWNDFVSLQCVLFGTFMIWFASITINLGPTFLSGALAANTETGHNAPSCPLVHGPFRHYILNVLWIVINVICVALTLFHLRKLHRDLTKANVEAVSLIVFFSGSLFTTNDRKLQKKIWWKF